MPRYINEDEFCEYIRKNTTPSGAEWFISKIKDMPSADVIEVKHGKWIKTYEYGNADLVQCSACLMEFDYIDGVCYLTDRKLPEFCPNCGADMRERKETE